MISNDLKSACAPIFLIGATGTGKSAAAMELARSHTRTCPTDAAILAMDAMQVYRGTNIGTGKPTAAERAEIPHGGVDVVDFGGYFDVAQYLRHAAAFLREQREAGRRVMIVGGTGLYFRALTRGLCEAPEGSEELRAELAALSAAFLRERLRKVDPAMLDRVDAANPRRLARAIEVMEVTGRSLRTWQEETPEPLVRDFTAFWIQREKGELSRRIEERVETMFAAGWVEEVWGLAERYGAEAVRSFPGIGYREIGDSCGGQLIGTRGKEGTGAGPAPATLRKMKNDIVVATRQYAKRQLTWFAREPNLRGVMLTGNQPLPAVLRAAMLRTSV